MLPGRKDSVLCPHERDARTDPVHLPRKSRRRSESGVLGQPERQACQHLVAALGDQHLLFKLDALVA